MFYWLSNNNQTDPGVRDIGFEEGERRGRDWRGIGYEGITSALCLSLTYENVSLHCHL
jgi:hypothetical protein